MKQQENVTMINRLKLDGIRKCKFCLAAGLKYPLRECTTSNCFGIEYGKLWILNCQQKEHILNILNLLFTTNFQLAKSLGIETYEKRIHKWTIDAIFTYIFIIVKYIISISNFRNIHCSVDVFCITIKDRSNCPKLFVGFLLSLYIFSPVAKGVAGSILYTQK